MKKLITLSILWLFLANSAMCASTTSKKASIYNSKGQRTGYYRVYTNNKKVTKIEKFETKTGRRVERIKYE